MTVNKHQDNESLTVMIMKNLEYYGPVGTRTVVRIESNKSICMNLARTQEISHLRGEDIFGPVRVPASLPRL